MGEEAERSGWGSGRFKIWRNPSGDGEYPVFLGEFRPPKNAFCFTSDELRELGLGPGHYTILAPEDFVYRNLFKRWQSAVLR